MVPEVNERFHGESRTPQSDTFSGGNMTKGLTAIPFILLAVFAVISIFIPLSTDFDGSTKYNFADISWLLIASALVLLMTPGLSFFYGGMVSKKNVISTMLQSFIAT